MKTVLLFIVSIILLALFSFWSVIIATEKIIRAKASDSYFFECAIAVDVLGNILGQHLWNFAFIANQGYQFGKRGETMSSVLGKNQRDNTLITLGKSIAKILDKFQKNHCLISIIEWQA